MTRASIFAVSVAALLALSVAAPGNADAKQIKYSGMHPISSEGGGGFCYIDYPHVHVYEPENAGVLYRVNDDHYDFVGDPVGFRYEGPKYPYYGHHPIIINASVYIDVDVHATDYCYMDGPHYHEYEPPPGLSFTMKGDAYWYIGKFPKPYHKNRKHLAQVNAVYKPIVYERPVVVVDAPPVGYVGPVVEVHAHTPAVEVVAPAVEVHVPVPTLDVHIGGGVIIDHRHRHHKHKKYKKFKRGRGHWKH